MLDLQGEPPVENLQGGLASKKISHGRTGGGRRLGQWGTKVKELEKSWQMIDRGYKDPRRHPHNLSLTSSQGWSLHNAILLRSLFKLFKLGRLETNGQKKRNEKAS